ncbi:MAG: hypothetical protein IJ087_08860 [Eggerthellaceae bacterium]|nr:hypothetical protein [Eggerthellaceae bacterium]
MRAAALAIVAALCVCCLALAACEGRNEPGDVVIPDETSPLVTPAYYVFESATVDGDTITDPSEFFVDRLGETENWYYLSIAIHDGRGGKLCTDGRIADFTYERVDDAIILNVPLDFGYDGAKLELGEGTLTMKDASSTTVLRLVDEAPTAALAAD